jgi:hypothetical protein
MHSRRAILLAATLLLAASAPLRAAPHFCDKFKTVNDPAWSNQDGAWAIAKHKYYATKPSNDPLTYTDLVNYPSLTDFTLTVTVNDVFDGGIWLRSNWNGASNGILLVVGGAASNYTGIYWHIVTNGQVSPPQGVVEVPGLEGSTAKIMVVVKGNTYAAYVNGGTTPTTMLTDSTYAAGSAGLYDNSSAPEETFGAFCVK